VALAPTGYSYRTDEERKSLVRPRPAAPSMHLGGHKNPVVLELESDGSHLSRIWQHATSLLYQGQGAPGVIMLPPEDLPAEDLEFVNDWMLGYLGSVGNQLPTLQAVRKYDPDTRLPLVKAPSLIIESTGPFEPKFLQRAELVAKLIPGSRVAAIENGDIHMIHFRAEELGGLLLEFFREAESPKEQR